MLTTFANRARMTTATTGTGTLTLGSALTGYLSFAEAGVANGATVSYCIEDGNNIEIGHGIYTASGTTLTRNVIASKIHGEAIDTTPISLSGSAKVFLTLLAEDIRNLTGPYFNVQEFGATGDGTTDDSAAIQAALDAAAAGSQKRVYVPHTANGYAIGATLTIDEGVTLFGDNLWGQERSRIKPRPGFTSPLLRTEDYGVTRKLRVGIVGLFFDGSSTTLTAIQANIQESLIQNCTIKNCFTYGIHFGGISSGPTAQALNNHILDNYLAGQIGVTEFFDGIFIDYFSADNTIERNYIEASKDAGIRSRGYNNKITNNHIYSVAGTGGGVGAGIYTETSADHDISQNYIELCAAEGVLMQGGGSDVATLAAAVHGNVFRNIDTGNTSNGVIEIAGADVSAVSVSGNVVRRDAATSYATPYFVYFNGITPTLQTVIGNSWQSSLVTIGESNLPQLPGLSLGNTLSITPPAASTTRGISISQTGPSSGTDPQSTVYFNRIDINAAGTHATSEGDIIGLGVSVGLGGANAAGQHIALFGQTVVNAATSNTPQPFLKVYVGVTGIAQGSVNDGGTGTGNSTDAKGYVLGMNAFSILNNGATNYLHCTPMEMLTSVRTGASVRTHVGARIVQYFDHAVSGANLDAGLQFINQTGAVGWEDYGIIFDGTSDDAGTLFKSTATVLGVTGTPTITHGIDFQTVSFTGAAFRSNGFFVNGGGDVVSANHIGGLAASSSLTLQSTAGVGTTDFIRFRVGNNGAVEAGRVVSAGQIIIGHTAAIAVNSEAGSAFTPQLEIHATGAGATESITRWSADANPGRFVMAKSRGASIGTRGAVQNADVLGLILFDGDDGTNFLPGAYIRAVVDGTPGTNDLPTQLNFATTQDGASTPTQWTALRANGSWEHAGSMKSSHATGGIGYNTGAGGAVTQATSRTTGVTLNTICGEITLVSAAGSATYASFTVTNSAMAATDTVEVNQKSGTDLYEIHVTAKAAGSFRITFRTTGGTTSEQPVFGFSITKAVAA